jgi:predicted esterase
MSRVLLAATVAVLCCGAAFAQALNPPPTGKVIPKIICSANSQQSYALYLPSHFSPNKRWPIIYAFDPLARGQVAVETIQAAAERYGYIVVGSNNSRNGRPAVSTEAAKAIWQDAQERFPVDERRRYLAGMSGGSRLVTSMALQCNGCVAGVIANAAGFPVGRKPSSALPFAYFATVGNADFNFAEFLELRRELEESKSQYRIRVFEGQHGWAPPEVWLEALDWMDMEAMRANSLDRDPARIQQSYEAATQRASQLLSGGDVLGALRDYQFSVREFKGMTDVTAAEKMVTDLSRDKRVKSAEKEESSAVADQLRLMSGPSTQMDALAEGNMSPDEFMVLRGDMGNLQRQISSSYGKGDAQDLVQRRALSGLVIQAFEAGQSSMDQKKYDVALHFFDLVVAGSHNQGWGHYHRARAYAAMADKKHSLAELKSASEAGFQDPSALAAPEFTSVQQEPEFQELQRKWSASSPQ